MKKKVLVSGCFDMLHSGHVAFLNEAATYGDELYVALGSDQTIEELKGRRTINSEDERQYLIANLKSVTKCIVSKGSGYLDFVHELKEIMPDIFVVNEDGNSSEKERLCKKLGIATIMSHRSGETLDYTIADLAFAWQTDFLKCSVIGQEREIKWKRLIEIEKSLSGE